jgi:ABC-type glycerol-3-phosphate transport system permease component
MRQRHRLAAAAGALLALGTTALEAMQYWYHHGWVLWLWLVLFPLGLLLLAIGLNAIRLDLGTRVIGGVLALFVVSALVLPFVVVIVLGSFQRRIDALTGPHVIPPAFSAQYYGQLFNLGQGFGATAASVFPDAFRDSLIVATATAIFTTICALLGAYAIARVRFPGRSAVHTAVMFTYMLPGIILLVPLYGIIKSLHLVDTLAGMFLGHSAFILPFVVWLMVGAFETVDPDTEHAARVDGCSRIAALRRVVLPLTVPSIATTAVFAFVLSWNELLFAKVMYISQTPMLAPTIVNFMDPINRIEPQLSAAGFVSSLPVLVLALLMQRYIIRGIGEGSVK